VINRYKMAKHFALDITDTSLTITRRVNQIATEAALEGIYVLRTNVPAVTLDAPAYKDLAHVERDFRSIKTDDLDLQPIHHYLPDRVCAHVLICMLACDLTWHLRHALAELTYTDEQPPTTDNPAAPAIRSSGAQRKAGRTPTTPASHGTVSGACSNTATLTRNRITLGHTNFDKITTPTSTQRRAFELIDSPISMALKQPDHNHPKSASSQLNSKTSHSRSRTLGLTGQSGVSATS
jgi:hypothetical protein